MKSKYLIMPALAIMLLTGCTKQKTSNIEDDDYLIEGTPVTTIYAQALGEDETKVDFKEEGNKTVITWKEGDEIRFYLKATDKWRDLNNVYVLSSGAGTKHGTFVVKEGCNPLITGQRYLPVHNISASLSSTFTDITIRSYYLNNGGYLGNIYVPNEQSNNNPISFKDICTHLYFNCNPNTFSYNGKEETIKVSSISISNVSIPNDIIIGTDEVIRYSYIQPITTLRISPNKPYHFVDYPENSGKDYYLSLTYNTNYGVFNMKKNIQDVRPGKGYRFSFTPVIPPDYIENGVNYGKGTFLSEINLWVAPFNCGYDKDNYPLGKLFQWGRKYGQGYDDGEIFDMGLILGDVAKEVGPSDNTRLLNPKDDTFYIYGSQEYDWLTGLNGEHLTYWKYLNDKIDTPCPPGWRIPIESDGLENLASYDKQYFGNKRVNIPLAGGRSGGNGECNGRNISGCYWIDTDPIIGSMGYYHISESTKYKMVICKGTDYSSRICRAHGYSVRCVH